MSNIIDSYYSQHNELSEFLSSNNEISLKSDADSRFTKVLVLASASYFEERILDCLSTYSSDVLSGDEKIMGLLRAKAFERQYHTLFDWKENNANRFFSHFGNEIKNKHKDDVKENDRLKECEKDFMNLGRLRNVLVHSNFAVVPISDTHSEIYAKFKNAVEFVEYIETIFETGSEQ